MAMALETVEIMNEENAIESTANELMANPENNEQTEPVTNEQRQTMQVHFGSNMNFGATRALHEFIRSVAVQGGLDANDAWAVQGHIENSTGNTREYHQELVILDDFGNNIHQTHERGAWQRIGLDNLGDFVHPLIFTHLREAIHIIAKRIKRHDVSLVEMLDPVRRALFERLAANRMRMSSVLSGHQYLLDKTHDRLNIQAKHIINAIIVTFKISLKGERRRERGRIRA